MENRIDVDVNNGVILLQIRARTIIGHIVMPMTS